MRVFDFVKCHKGTMWTSGSKQIPCMQHLAVWEQVAIVHVKLVSDCLLTCLAQGPRSGPALRQRYQPVAAARSHTSFNLQTPSPLHPHFIHSMMTHTAIQAISPILPRKRMHRGLWVHQEQAGSQHATQSLPSRNRFMHALCIEKTTIVSTGPQTWVILRHSSFWV